MADRRRVLRWRSVTVYLDELGEALGWGIEFHKDDEVSRTLWCACVSPWNVAELLSKLDTVSPSTRRDEISWTSWAGGARPIKPVNQIKLQLPGWVETGSTFFSDGSVQFPLGVAIDDDNAAR